MLESQEADPFVKESVVADLLVPEATLATLRAGTPSPEETVDIDALHEKGLLAVDKLSVKNCVQLLRGYLIGLGVMDCSVMMSLKAVTFEGEAPTAASSVQGQDVAGVFQTGDGRRVAYCVSVVDAGPKPPTKLSSKAKHEDEIWNLVAGLGNGALV